LTLTRSLLADLHPALLPTACLSLCVLHLFRLAVNYGLGEKPGAYDVLFAPPGFLPTVLAGPAIGAAVVFDLEVGHWLAAPRRLLGKPPKPPSPASRSLPL
jgi:hypothetical protein